MKRARLKKYCTNRPAGPERAARLYTLQAAHRPVAQRHGDCATGGHAWAAWPDERLLELPINRLRLRLGNCPALVRRIERVLSELAARGLRFAPHFWLGEDWFSADGIPGVAVPFYLAHPRLLRLERKMVGEAEGSSASGCQSILRHEVGHALDHAYGLHRRRDWQQHFGRSSERYPSSYRPKPASRKYVLHLDAWYAQSHPDEDFAETFAVWLASPRSWRQAYRGWPALRKLEYVDRLMQEIAAKRPINTSRARFEPLEAVSKTLRQHYEEKRAQRSAHRSPWYDRDLRRLFGPANGCPSVPAERFIHRCRTELHCSFSPVAVQERYNLDQFVREILSRCRELQLHAVGGRQLKARFLSLLTRRQRQYIHNTRHHVGM